LLRFSAEVQGVVELDRAFNRVNEYISDFRSIWPSVTTTVYSIFNQQFASEGAHGASGKWPALSPAYKKWKEVNYPGQPILRLTNSLYESMTSPEGLDSIYRPERDSLTIGSKAPYAAKQHQDRPIISLTESDKREITKSIQLPLVQFIRKTGFTVMENAA
jgi:phage gpG-like protein